RRRRHRTRLPRRPHDLLRRPDARAPRRPRPRHQRGHRRPRLPGPLDRRGGRALRRRDRDRDHRRPRPSRPRRHDRVLRGGDGGDEARLSREGGARHRPGEGRRLRPAHVPDHHLEAGAAGHGRRDQRGGHDRGIGGGDPRRPGGRHLWPVRPGRDRAGGPRRPARQPGRKRAGHGGGEARLAGQRPAQRRQHRDRGRARGDDGADGGVTTPARSKARLYADLARPFTLLPPALGVVSGAVTAWGAGHHKLPVTAALVMPVVYGALMAAVLNAANNAVNQIYDLDIDRVNKPARPLPSGALTLREAWWFTIAATAVAWVLAWLAAPAGAARHECFWIVVITTGLCWIYSAPPIWTKRRGIWANITIAIPRGVLLKVAG